MSTKQIMLKSSDGDLIKVDEAVALQSTCISNLIGDGVDTTDPIPLANVSGDILRLVIKYCEKHVDDVVCSDSEKEERKKWDAAFVLEMKNSIIIDLIEASNYMDIPSLLDLTCQRVADMIAACKDADEIRDKFDIVKDLTPDDEEKIRQENQWAFQ